MRKKDLTGLVIGCGSIGERHLYNLKKNGIKKISIFDEDRKKLKFIANKYKIKKFEKLDLALSEKPDFAFICTYPSSHLTIGNECIKNDVNLFIEKPISSELSGVSSMLKKAKLKKLKIAVGYNTRFEKGLMFLKKTLKHQNIKPLVISCQFGNHIKNWRPNTDFKKHYILQKGGGIILDDSHEIDYVRWLFDDKIKSVFCQIRKSKNLNAKSDSIALIQLEFKSGIIANLTIDYLRQNYERNCHIIGDLGDLKWNFVPEQKSWKNYGSKVTTTVSLRKLNKNTLEKKFKNDVNNMYIDENNDFLNAIINNVEPKINGWDGFETLKIANAALESAKKNKIIRI